MRSRQVRRRLDRRLAVWRDLPPESRIRPEAGWVRTVREALGMSGADLAARLDVTPAAVAKLEASERGDRVRLDTLRRAADALECDLVYVLVPRRSLEDTVHDQAERLIDLHIGPVETSMRLEAQGLDPTDSSEARSELVEHAMEDRWLWKA